MGKYERYVKRVFPQAKAVDQCGWFGIYVGALYLGGSTTEEDAYATAWLHINQGK